MATQMLTRSLRSYPFTLYSGAIQPITIVVRHLLSSLFVLLNCFKGFVTAGQSFTLHPPIGDSFTWKNNLTAGTAISFYMYDSQGRQGGTSNVRVVSLSGDKSCLATPKHGKAGLIAAAVIGGVVGLVILFLLGFYFWKKRRDSGMRAQRSQGKMGLLYDPLVTPFQTGTSSTQPYDPRLNGQYTVIPFRPDSPPAVDPHRFSQKSQLASSKNLYDIPTISPQSSQFSGHSRRPVATVVRSTGSGSSDSPSTSEDQRLIPHNGVDSYPPPPRVIVHTDIADEMEEPLELPPQYSAGRRPIPGLSNPSGGQATPESESSHAQSTSRSLPPLPPPRKS